MTLEKIVSFKVCMETTIITTKKIMDCIIIIIKCNRITNIIYNSSSSTPHTNKTTSNNKILNLQVIKRINIIIIMLKWIGTI